MLTGYKLEKTDQKYEVQYIDNATLGHYNPE